MELIITIRSGSAVARTVAHGTDHNNNCLGNRRCWPQVPNPFAPVCYREEPVNQTHLCVYRVQAVSLTFFLYTNTPKKLLLALDQSILAGWLKLQRHTITKNRQGYNRNSQVSGVATTINV